MLNQLQVTIVICLAIILSGCKTLVLDEAFVFQPGQFGDAAAPRESKMRYESIFLEPTDLIINVWADGQKAKHQIDSKNFVKSAVSHDLISSGEDQLGVTLIERPRTGPLYGPRALVVHCGGNASDRYESGALYAQKIIPTADVLMFDYPGYGESTGQATAQSLRLANQTIADLAMSKIDAGRPLILWGHSLGGFVCADMGANFERVDGIILEATATNADAVSAAVIPWYAKLFIRTRITESLKGYDVVDMLGHVDAPILILGAAKDKTLPIKLSRTLSEELKAAGQDVTYVEFSEANHISIPVQDGYLAVIQRFISGLNENVGMEVASLSASESYTQP